MNNIKHTYKNTTHRAHQTTKQQRVQYALKHSQQCVNASDNFALTKHTRGDTPGGSSWHQQQSCLQTGHTAGRHCDISEKDGFSLTSIALQA